MIPGAATTNTASPVIAFRPLDPRGRRVVFLSHCLLNENTRYPGGAGRPCAVSEIVQGCLQNDVGIVQLPCPEAQAWGGVAKRWLMWFFGSAGTMRFGVRRVLLPLMLRVTRHVYRRLARNAARQITDYRRSGVAVLGIVGVDGSPSCGVARTLDMPAALDRAGHLPLQTATSPEMTALVRDTQIDGRGLFIECLKEELDRRGVPTPFVAHDLLAELDGKPSSVDVSALLRGRAEDE